MYRFGHEEYFVSTPTLREMKHNLKLTCEAHLARTYHTFVVKDGKGNCYDVRVEIKLEKK